MIMKKNLLKYLIIFLACPVSSGVAGDDKIIPDAGMGRLTAEAVMSAQRVGRVSPVEDHLLRSVEFSDRVFKRLENPLINRISYFHQRKIGEVLVEKDFIRYQFDASSNELLEQTRKWRENLPETVEVTFSQAQAEAKVDDAVRSSHLMFISPDSEIFHITPVPKNPCWIVRSMKGEQHITTVIDAVTGEILGNGTPPPYEGLSIHGPDWGACPQDAIWTDHAENAHDWFETMGYDSIRVGNASEATVQSHVQSDSTVMFYELDHGGSYDFHNRCDQNINATEIETWINSYSSIGFAFIGSCGGLCDTGENTFTTEFSKGFNPDSAIVGYCGMDDAACDDCWPNAIAWQTELFTRMNQGYTVASAYAFANADWPDCTDDSHNCMRIAGDTSLVFGGSTYPDVRRSLCGSLYDFCFSGFCISPLYPVSSTYYTRAHHIRCNSSIPSGDELTVSANSSYPNNEVVFVNNASLTATGTLTAATGSGSRVSFVSAADRSQGVEMSTSAEMEISNGGQMRIYE